MRTRKRFAYTNGNNHHNVVIDAIILLRIMFISLPYSTHMFPITLLNTEHTRKYAFFSSLHSFIIRVHTIHQLKENTQRIVRESTLRRTPAHSWAAVKKRHDINTTKRTISRAHISTNRNWPCVFMFSSRCAFIYMLNIGLYIKPLSLYWCLFVCRRCRCFEWNKWDGNTVTLSAVCSLLFACFGCE